MEGLLNRGLAEPSSRAFTTWRQAGLTPYGVQGSEAFLETYDLTTRVTSETRKGENIIRKSILGLQFRGPPHTLRLCSWASIHFGIKHPDIYRGTGKVQDAN